MNRIVIDVREPEEYADGHVKKAVNLPLSELENGTADLNRIPKNSDIIVYCGTGKRSNVAKNILNNIGFRNVVNGINKEQVESQLMLS